MQGRRHQRPKRLWPRYRPNPEDPAARAEWFDAVEAFWAACLDAFKDHLEKEQ